MIDKKSTIVFAALALVVMIALAWFHSGKEYSGPGSVLPSLKLATKVTSTPKQNGPTTVTGSVKFSLEQ